MKPISVIAASILAFSGIALAESPQGRWTMPNGKFIVKLISCGSNLCGKIVGLKEPTYADGKIKTDRHNENKSLRARPLMGLALLNDMKPAGQGTWKGNIYNPDDGQTYSATIKLDGHAMKLQGCVAGIFCKTQKFVRAN